jgi:hypothetical protein
MFLNPPKAEEHYEPTVKVSTKKIEDMVEINSPLGPGA